MRLPAEPSADGGHVHASFSAEHPDQLVFLGPGFGFLGHSVFSVLVRQVESDAATEQSPETPGGEVGARHQVRRKDSTALFGGEVQSKVGLNCEFGSE